MSDQSSFDTSNIDPQTLAGLMQVLPQIQQQQRRVQQMRAAQQQMQDATQNQPPPQNYQPRQQGGLYPTVQQYHKDYGNAGQGLANTIGQVIAQRQGNNAEDQLNQTRNAAILKSVQGASAQPTADNPTAGIDPNLLNQKPTTATLRAYLALMGGPNVKDIVGVIPHVSGKYVGNDGYVYKIMSNGDEIKSGEKSNLPVGSHVDEVTGQWVALPKSTAQMEGGGYAPQGPQGQQQPQQPQGQQPVAASAQNGDLFARHLAVENPSGDNSLVSNKGAYGVSQLMPDTGAEMEKLLGMKPGQTRTDAKANRLAGQMYFARLQNQFGDDRLASMAYNWGPQNVQALLTGQKKLSDVPAETSAYVDKIYGPGTYQNAAQQFAQQNGATGPAPASPAVAPAGNTNGPTLPGAAPGATGQTVLAQPGTKVGASLADKMQYAVAEAAAKKQAELQAVAQNAPIANANNASLDSLKEQSTNQAKLKDALPGMQNSMTNYIKEIDDLLADPHLKDVVGGRMPTLMASEHDNPHVALMNNALFANDPRLTTDRKLQQVKNAATLQTIQQNKALFQRVTNKDVGIEQMASNRIDNAQQYKAVREELLRLRGLAVQSMDTLKTSANRPLTPANIPGQTVLPGQANQSDESGSMSDDDLRKKYGL